MNVFTILIAVLGSLCAVRPYRFMVYLMIGICVFGSTAAIIVGNTGILAAHFTLMFFVVRTYLKLGPSAFLTPFHPMSPGFMLLLFALFGLCSAFLFPTLFAGSVQVFNIVEVRGVQLFDLVPLRFGSGNINQAVYLIGNVLAFACAFSLARLPGASEVFFKAIIAVAILNILMAFLDLATWSTGTSYLLSFIKTANLAFLDDNEIGGLKRISGSFSETSAFSAFTLRLFGICFSLWINRIRPSLTGWLSAVMFVLLMLSTSSTAYIGLCCVIPIVVGRNLWSVATKRMPASGLARLAVIGLVAVAGITLVVLFVPPIATAVSKIADQVLFNKLNTDSGHERGAWNQQGLQNFLDTYGLGVGIGSTRASSSVVVLLSNVGLIGTVLYALFVLQCFQNVSRPDTSAFDAAFFRACRIGLLASMSAQLVSGTVIDIGIINAIIFGICAADVFNARVSRAMLHRESVGRSGFGAERRAALGRRPVVQ